MSKKPYFTTLCYFVRCLVVPKAGLEPARLAAGDFESPASTIPPLGPIFSVRLVYSPLNYYSH